MEVRPGYQQTEIGVIPADWQLRPMLSAVRVANGQVDPKVEPYRSMTLVAPDHIESGTGRLLEKRTASDQGAISGKYVVAKGDVVYSKIRPYLRKAILADFDGLCSADMYPLKPARDVAAGFVLAAILGHHFSKFAESVSMRSGMPKINRAELAEYTMALPPTKVEQEAIADALGDADAFNESLEQLLMKKRQIRQGAMRELLTGKRRLPGFSGEWEVKRLGSVLKFQVGFPFSSAFFNEEGEGIRLVKNRDLKSNDQVFSYSGNLMQEFLVRDGDVLVGMDGDFLPCLWPKGPALLNQRVGRIVPLSGLDRVFGFYYLIEPLKEIENATSSTTVKHLSHGDIVSIEKALPPVEEQTAIAHVLSGMDAEIAELNAKLAKARQLKQGMMQELLTGKIRLK
jgi:type I restriction enzyme, S subunit